MYTVTQLWFWTSVALFLCGLSSINILESLLPYVCVHKTWTKEILLSVPLQLLQTVFLYPLARHTEFTQLFSNHIYGEIFPQRIKYMSLRHSQGSVPCNSSCYRLVYFWGRLAKSRTRLSDWTELNWTEGSGKEPDAGRDWGQEEKGTTEDEMAGWHHWLDWLEFG